MMFVDDCEENAGDFITFSISSTDVRSKEKMFFVREGDFYLWMDLESRKQS